MLGRIAVQVVDLQRTVAHPERSRRETCWSRICSSRPPSQSALFWLDVRADAFLVRRAIAPASCSALSRLVVRRAHPARWRHRCSSPSPGRSGSPARSSAPSHAPSHSCASHRRLPMRRADLGGLARLHPDDGIRRREYQGTRTDRCRPWRLRDACVAGSYSGAMYLPWQIFSNVGILVADALRPCSLAWHSSGVTRMAGDGGIALADVPGLGEDAANRGHLGVRQRVDALQLPQQRFVLLVQRLRSCARPTDAHKQRRARSDERRDDLHGRTCLDVASHHVEEIPIVRISDEARHRLARRADLSSSLMPFMRCSTARSESDRAIDGQVGVFERVHVEQHRVVGNGRPERREPSRTAWRRRTPHRSGSVCRRESAARRPRGSFAVSDPANRTSSRLPSGRRGARHRHLRRRRRFNERHAVLARMPDAAPAACCPSPPTSSSRRAPSSSTRIVASPAAAC